MNPYLTLLPAAATGAVLIYDLLRAARPQPTLAPVRALPARSTYERHAR